MSDFRLHEDEEQLRRAFFPDLSTAAYAEMVRRTSNDRQKHIIEQEERIDLVLDEVGCYMETLQEQVRSASVSVLSKMAAKRRRLEHET